MTVSPSNIQVTVRDFGPIEHGRVDLRPLTVFVGPSNTVYEERTPQSEYDLLNEIADVLERRTLAGSIRATKSPGGYPVFAYRPTGSDEDIRLTRASSMVSEIAPVVLLIRGVLNIGDTLIIEEPEAHLHPAAQTQIAMTLARLSARGSACLSQRIATGC